MVAGETMNLDTGGRRRPEIWVKRSKAHVAVEATDRASDEAVRSKCKRNIARGHRKFGHRGNGLVAQLVRALG